MLRPAASYLGTTYREYFINVVALDARRVEIVFNGVPDPDVQRPVPRQATCELLFAGVLNERKGLQDLLTALASDRLRQAPWHLSIAGNGDDTPFRNQSEMSGLADKVTFLGWLPPPKMHDLFAASDVLVLPSRNEGLPMVIVEAMASGLAVISTPVGSIGDAVVEGVNGLLVPPKDVDALATALATVIEAPGGSPSHGSGRTQPVSQEVHDFRGQPAPVGDFFERSSMKA